MYLTTLTPILLLPLLATALPQADEVITTTRISTRTIIRTMTATDPSYLPLVAATEPAPHATASTFPDISINLGTASVPTDILVAPPSSTPSSSSTSTHLLSSASAGTGVPLHVTTATGTPLPSATGSAIGSTSPIATFTGAATRHAGNSGACVGAVLAVAALVGACL